MAKAKLMIQTDNGEIDFSAWIKATNENRELIEINLKNGFPNSLIGFAMAIEMLVDIRQVGNILDGWEHYHEEWNGFNVSRYIDLVEMDVLPMMEMAWLSRRNSAVDEPFRENLRRVVGILFRLKKKSETEARVKLHRQLEGRFETISLSLNE